MNASHPTTDATNPVSFLREQMNEVDRKIARLESGAANCEDCLESESLERMLSAAQTERDQLHELLMHQLSGGAVSLEAALIEHGRRAHREAELLGSNWRRGQSTPPAYWENETKQAFYAELLRRWHVWEQDGPRHGYPAANATVQQLVSGPDGAPIYSHPWYLPPNGAGNGNHTQETHHEDLLAALQAEIVTALREEHLPDDHLTITVQPGGEVLLTGYAHSAQEREAIILLLMGLNGVWELLVDLQIVDEAHCPVCHPPAQGV
jgi:hypothetical protein